MTSIATDFTQWRETLRHSLPPGMRALFEGGSKRELLKQVDVTVLVFNDLVVNLATGKQATLAQVDPLECQALAAACTQVLGHNAGEASVMLLLPPAEFVSTTVAIPGLARDALMSALQLQAESLLPSFGQKLSLSVNPSGTDTAHSDIALWITEQRLDELFEAFAGNNMFLASVLPRALILADDFGELDLIEVDDHSSTHVTMRRGALTLWQHVTDADLAQDIFLKQWHQSLSSATALQRTELATDNAIDRYRNALKANSPSQEYAFFPGSALQAKRQVAKGKRAIMLAGAIAFVAFIGALPFLAQSFEINRLQASLESQRGLSQGAREDRAVVQNFEDEWGLINDFPMQDVREAMFTLQSVLSPDQLTSLELSEGIIQIEGESAEPQGILQRLEQHPLFTEVAFSRATNDSRYYIDLRLSTVNFEGYMVRYFPDN